MQFEQARQIPLAKILLKWGFSPAYERRAGEELWYCSPLRTEKTPSFKIDVRRNLWFDFGENVGGSPIDLVIKIFGSDVNGALAVLANFENMQAPIFENKDPSVFSEEKAFKNTVFELERVVDFDDKNTSLHHYIIAERCIDAKIATRFLKIVHFKHLSLRKSFVAVGVQNTEGGYEIRNASFKGTVPENRKSFSWFETATDNTQIVCFEGLLDFLSYGTFFGWQHEDYLILNSTLLSKKAIEFLEEKNYKKIKTFFDNDRAGEQATFLFQEAFDCVVPQNAIFEGFEDFNAFLVNVKNQLK